MHSKAVNNQNIFRFHIKQQPAGLMISLDAFRDSADCFHILLQGILREQLVQCPADHPTDRGPVIAHLIPIKTIQSGRYCSCFLLLHHGKLLPVCLKKACFCRLIQLPLLTDSLGTELLELDGNTVFTLSTVCDTGRTGSDTGFQNKTKRVLCHAVFHFIKTDQSMIRKDPIFHMNLAISSLPF